MAQSLLVQQLLQQLLSGGGQQMLSPLAPVGKLALAAALKNQQKKQEYQDAARANGLVDVLVGKQLDPQAFDKLAPGTQEAPRYWGNTVPAYQEQQAAPQRNAQRDALSQAMGGDPSLGEALFKAKALADIQPQGNRYGSSPLGIFDRTTGQITQPVGQDSPKPQSSRAKILADYKNGMFGDPGSPEAKTELQAALEADAGRGKTTVSIDMPGSNVPLTSANETAFQAKIMAGRDQLSNLRTAAANFNPMFLTYKGQFDMTKLKARDLVKGIPVVEGMLGGKLNEEQKKLLGQYANWQQSSYETLNQGIKEMTGASMSVQEADRIRKQFPDPDEDSPEQYRAKFNNTVRRLSLADVRYSMALKEGIPVSSAADLEKYMSLDDVRNKINQRGDEIYQQLTKSGLPEADAKKKMLELIQQEYGVSF